MIVPLLVPLTLAAAGTVVPAGIGSPDPPVQVWFDSDGEFERGDAVRVFVRALEDGYLVVVHADERGRVRVLFPLDPVQDDYVRGGQTLELLGRGGREAFSIMERSGSGLVMAAWSRDPFWFDGLVRGDHWDYRVIAPDGVAGDPEAGLLDIVHRMAAGQPFDYDAAPYFIGRPAAPVSNVHVSFGIGSTWCVGCAGWRYSARPGFSLSLSIGGPFWYATYYSDPFYVYAHPVWYRPVYYDPFRVRVVRTWYDPWYDPYWYRPVWYDPYWYRPIWYDRYRIARPVYRPGWGVGTRFAGNCWGDPFCHDRGIRGPRPGRATGIGFGDNYWRFADGGGQIRSVSGTGIGRIAGPTQRTGTPTRGSGEGIGRVSGQPTRFAQPRDGRQDAGPPQPSPDRTRQASPAQQGPEPLRARTLPDVVRGATPGVPTQQRQGTSAVVRASEPNSRSGQPDRSAILRSSGAAGATQPQRSAEPRGIGQTRTVSPDRNTPPASNNSSTRIVPQSRAEPQSRSNSASRGIGAVRSGTSSSSTRVVPSSPPNRTSRGIGAVRSGSSSSGTRVVPSSPPNRTSGGIGAVRSGSSSSGTRVVPSSPPSRTSRGIGAVRSGSSSSGTRVVPSSPPASTRVVPQSRSGSTSRVMPSTRSGVSSRAVPSTRSGTTSRAVPPSRSGSSGISSSRSSSSSRAAPAPRPSAPRSAPAARSSAPSRSSTARSSGSSGGSSRGVASARASGSAKRKN